MLAGLFRGKWIGEFPDKDVLGLKISVNNVKFVEVLESGRTLEEMELQNLRRRGGKGGMYLFKNIYTRWSFICMIVKHKINEAGVLQFTKFSIIIIISKIYEN